MFHKGRRWCVGPVESADELADWLTQHTMCCCMGFELDGYLFLNDATSPDGAGEYGVVKKPRDTGAAYLQIESITFGWCDFEKGLGYIRDILAGQYDQSEFTHPVELNLQTTEEHGRCGHCA